SAEQIDCADNSYDAVVAMGLVEFLDDEREILKEARRILRPGGRFLVSICNRLSPLRMWDRYLRIPLSKTMRPVVGKELESVFHRPYSGTEYSRLLGAEGFGDCSWAYYNFRLLPRPFDLWFPRVSVGISRQIEPLRHTPLRFWGTGVIVDARRL